MVMLGMMMESLEQRHWLEGRMCYDPNDEVMCTPHFHFYRPHFYSSFTPITTGPNRQPSVLTKPHFNISQRTNQLWTERLTPRSRTDTFTSRSTVDTRQYLLPCILRLLYIEHSFSTR
jgi:hypothetical protein